MRVPIQQFFENAFAAIGEIPARAWRFALIVIALSAGIDLALQITMPDTSIVILAAALLIFPWQAALCVGILDVLRRPATFAAWFRFTAANLATLAPLTMAILAMVWLGKHSYDLAMALMGVASFGFLVLMALLAAWPAAQAISKSFVSPLRIIRETRGHRWALLIASTVSAGIAKTELSPAITGTADTGAILMALLGGVLMNLILFAAQAGIAVAAWRAAVGTNLADPR